MTLRASLVVLLLATSSCAEPSAKAAREAADGDVDLLALRRQESQSDPLARRADSLTRAGRAWRATALLAPPLTKPDAASPEVRVAGARAAAAWDGWTEVQRILRSATWLDSQFGGDGRELLARSALELRTNAVADARLALTHAGGNATRATREVLLARAHDQANARDSAALYYASAAAKISRVGDWLRLRAAGATDDSTQRNKLFSRVALPVAKARVQMTDAQARERIGDFAGAARAFRGAGAEASAFRVEMAAARDSQSRVAVANKIVTYLRTPHANPDVRQTLEVLDKLPPLTASQNLIIATAAAASGSYARAASSFSRAGAAGLLKGADRMAYANALARTSRTAEAMVMYAGLAQDSVYAGMASYQRSRLMAQSGNGAGARQSLRNTATQYASAPLAAAPALLLLADLQVDDADMAGAESSLRELVARHPRAQQAPLARFRLGLIQWTEAPVAAAQTFDSLATLHAGDDEAIAGRYWAARSYDKIGRRAEAEARWSEVVRTSPLSYYAMLSAKRLKSASWQPPAGPDTVAHVTAIDSAVQRILVLRELGMNVEAGFERDAIADRATKTPTDAAAVVQALRAVSEPARALRVALAAIDAGGSSRALYVAAFPVVHDEVLREESARNGLDPALVAGLIRQESSWNPRALSVADARGLMQLLPRVGAAIAASKRYPLWNTALLYEPDVSLELGTTHLASSLKRGTPAERALAAYNAGASRVTRWVQRPGTDDPELFTEWIPFTETRDYVRIVLRNAAIYRALRG